MGKNSFVLYQSYYEILKDLSDLERGQLLNAIFIYEIENRVIDLSPVLKMAFAFIKKDLDSNKEKYQKTVEKNRDNANKRWSDSKKDIEKSNENATASERINSNAKKATAISKMRPHAKHADDVDVDVDDDDDDDDKEKKIGLTNVKPHPKSCDILEVDKPDKGGGGEKFNIFAENTVNLWNAFCVRDPTFAKVMDLTPERRKRLKLRFLRQRFRNFEDILAAIERQPFLRGEGEKRWKVTFDWLIENDTNFMKVLEFRYSQNEEVGKGTAQRRVERIFGKWVKESENGKT